MPYATEPEKKQIAAGGGGGREEGYGSQRNYIFLTIQKPKPHFTLFIKEEATHAIISLAQTDGDSQNSGFPLPPSPPPPSP